MWKKKKRKQISRCLLRLESHVCRRSSPSCNSCSTAAAVCHTGMQTNRELRQQNHRCKTALSISHAACRWMCMFVHAWNVPGRAVGSPAEIFTWGGIYKTFWIIYFSPRICMVHDACEMARGQNQADTTHGGTDTSSRGSFDRDPYTRYTLSGARVSTPTGHATLLGWAVVAPRGRCCGSTDWFHPVRSPLNPVSERAVKIQYSDGLLLPIGKL